ncbi:MAG: PAS domain-containing protein [Candidatus Hydrogenedentota bacterium]
MPERRDKSSHAPQRREREMELAHLRAALALREQALEYCLEGITIADCSQPDLPLIYVNRGFERLTGYSREEVLGRNCRFLQGPATASDALDTIRKAIEKGAACTVELLNHRKDGATFWNRLALTPLRDDKGVLTHYVGIQSDVSERVRAQEELRAAYAEMARSLHAAAKVQQALLPASSPVADPLRVAWRFRPCEALAGDILNVFSLDDTHVGVYLLDVTGHGAPAALLAVSVSQLLAPEARTSSLVRELTTAAGDRIVPPAEVAGRLNTRFTWDTNRGQFFTLIYGVLDTQRLSFEYVCAGHPPELSPVWCVIQCGQVA